MATIPHTLDVHAPATEAPPRPATRRSAKAGHLPEESQLGRVATGVLIGIPVMTVFGTVLFGASLWGSGAEHHALVLSLPFGGMFGILCGSIAGLMATMKH